MDARLQEKLDCLRHVILQEILHGSGAQHLQVLLYSLTYLLQPSGPVLECYARALVGCGAVSAWIQDEAGHVAHA